MKPQSCDTFVFLPPATADNFIIFGKNSDRPSDEVQEVVYVPAKDHAAGSKLKCTYIEIEQSAHTNAVILSKPAWMWGAEMGANEHGVVIGNEAVWTKVELDEQKRLLGMDFLRLGLERSSSAKECMNVITTLLEKYGQGGQCAESKALSYHNSFLITDRSGETYVLETAGSQWAAEKVQGGFRHISNNLTIRTNIDLMSSGLYDCAKTNGWWNGTDAFDFAAVYSKSGKACDEPRQKAGDDLCTKLSSNKLGVKDMISVLRDKKSGICRGTDDPFASTGSQVSILTPITSKAPCVHFFTATPDPSLSGYKPFVFAGAETQAAAHVISPKAEGDAAKGSVDRRHALYKVHENIFGGVNDNKKTLDKEILGNLMLMEEQSVSDILQALRAGEPIADAATLFKDSVEAEFRLLH